MAINAKDEEIIHHKNGNATGNSSLIWKELNPSVKLIKMSLYSEEEKLWSGPTIPPLYNSRVSVGQALLHAMKRSPRSVAQISANNGIQFTYEELYLQSVRAAQNIQKLNFQKGDVVAIISRNNHELAPVVVALMSTDLPFNPLDPSFTETEISYMLDIIKPKLVFSDLKSYDVVAKSLRNLKNDATIYTFEGRTGQSTPVERLFAETGQENEFVPPEVDGENDIAAILCSSGTTGPPKAISLSHKLLLNQTPRVFEVNSDDVGFCFTTLYWISGLTMLIVGILNSATRLITTDTFTGELMLKLIEQYKVTMILTAPHQLLMTLKCPAIETANLSSVRHWMAGGSRVPLDACKKISEYIPNVRVNAGYGMTELGGYNTLNYPFVDRECVGKARSGSQFKIVSENGKRLGFGESGEICIKMEIKFCGYYGNKEATNALYDSEGFIQTGDIGYFDEDGFLYVTDRKKDFLKYCNYMISPSEIEDFLIGCPDIQEACVVGISDRIVGDLPAAVVVRRKKSTITEQEISEMVEKNMADSRKLRGGVYFVGSLPLTASDKIQRRKVKLLANELYNTKTKSQ